MKRYIFVRILLAFSFCLTANSDSFNIWSEVDSVVDFKAKLHVFKADSSFNNHKAIIICPGGSYHHLGMKHEGFEVAKWLNTLGFNAFVLQYRVGVKGWRHPAMIQDLQRTIQVLRENPNKYEINPNSIGLMGFSAGGHLVCIASIYYETNYLEELGIFPNVSLKPDFSVLVYPVVSMQDSLVHKRSRKNLLGKNPQKQLIDKYSLEENIHKNISPMLIIHCKDDNVVDYKNSYYLYSHLKSLNGLVDLVLYKVGGHGFGLKNNKDIVNEFKKDLVEWFFKLGILVNK